MSQVKEKQDVNTRPEGFDASSKRKSPSYYRCCCCGVIQEGNDKDTAPISCPKCDGKEFYKIKSKDR